MLRGVAGSGQAGATLLHALHAALFDALHAPCCAARTQGGLARGAGHQAVSASRLHTSCPAASSHALPAQHEHRGTAATAGTHPGDSEQELQEVSFFEGPPALEQPMGLEVDLRGAAAAAAAAATSAASAGGAARSAAHAAAASSSNRAAYAPGSSSSTHGGGDAFDEISSKADLVGPQGRQRHLVTRQLRERVKRKEQQWGRIQWEQVRSHGGCYGSWGFLWVMGAMGVTGVIGLYEQRAWLVGCSRHSAVTPCMHTAATPPALYVTACSHPPGMTPGTAWTA